MGLKEKIDAEIKTAMIGKDKDALRALRGIKSLILLAETADGATGELSTDSEIKLLTKAAKQRRESIDIYLQQGRQDLADAEISELKIIERFLPKQLSEEEVTEKLKEIIARTGAKSAAEMGKVMGIATKELAGMAEGKLISGLVKSLLG